MKNMFSLVSTYISWSSLSLPTPEMRKTSDSCMVSAAHPLVTQRSYRLFSICSCRYVMKGIIRPKKNGFWPTLWIYVRPKLFYELDTVMRRFNTHTFSAVFPQVVQTSHYSRWVSLAALCPRSLRLPPLPLPLLLQLQTWHQLWVWPADDWLFCLKSRLSFCVRFIVQLVLMRWEIARFIDTGRACERSGARSEWNTVGVQSGF